MEEIKKAYAIKLNQDDLGKLQELNSEIVRADDNSLSLNSTGLKAYLFNLLDEKKLNNLNNKSTHNEDNVIESSSTEQAHIENSNTVSRTEAGRALLRIVRGVEDEEINKLRGYFGNDDFENIKNILNYLKKHLIENKKWEERKEYFQTLKEFIDPHNETEKWDDL